MGKKEFLQQIVLGQLESDKQRMQLDLPRTMYKN
jgi:hypothetical protein